MQRKYHIRTYQKEEYCFINLPINDLQQAAASLKELNFSILCTEANVHTLTAQKHAKVVGQPRVGFSTISFSGFSALGVGHESKSGALKPVQW